MKDNLRFEAKRKLVHILLTFWPLLFVFLGFSREIDLALYLVYLAFMFSSEFLRIRYGLNTPTAMLIRSVSRSTVNKRIKEEWKRVRIPYWIFGSIFAMGLFGPQIIIASTVCLSFGDSSSGVVKTILNKRKSLAASSIGILVSLILIYTLTGNIAMAAFSSVAGMIGDTSNIVNDNLSIPILAAVGGYLGSLV